MKKTSNTNGMTLIEIIVAMAILGIILMAFLDAFGFGFSTIFDSGFKTKAVSQAQALIDFVQNRDYITDSAALDITATGKTEIETAFPNSDYRDTNNVDDWTYDAANPILYNVERGTGATAGVHVMTVRVFYKNGAQSIVLMGIISPDPL